MKTVDCDAAGVEMAARQHIQGLLQLLLDG
jgi:hypothetical protein